MRSLTFSLLFERSVGFLMGINSIFFPNLLNCQSIERQQNKALVTDITYLWSQERFRYLSFVQDIYINEVVSWKVSKYNDNELELFKNKLLAQKWDVRGTILNLNEEFQYTSHIYNKQILGLSIMRQNLIIQQRIKTVFIYFSV